MGMKEAFGRRADFTGMEKTNKLFISDVFHKAFVEVNEKGTEAAAATAIKMAEKSSMKMPAFVSYTPTFNANRPFIYIIRDNHSGTIHFIGKMVKPSTK